MLENLVRRFAPQHGDQVFGAEALSGAQDRRQRLLRGHRAVDGLDGFETAVAVAARLAGFAEIAEQRLTPAAGGLAQGQQRVEPLVIDPLDLVGPVGIVDHQAADPDIVHAMEHEGLRRLAVAPGPSDLLVVRLDGRREVGVGDEPDVGLVDAHAEGDGRHHDDTVFGQETVLVPVPVALVHAGVIGECDPPSLGDAPGRPLCFLARQRIDDARPPGMPVQQLVDLPRSGLSRCDGETQVRTVEAGHEDVGLTSKQPRDDVLARHGIRGRREGAEHGAGKALRQFGEAAIVRPEIVAPLGDAMGLVDGKPRRAMTGEAFQRVRDHQPFRRDVEEAQAALAQQAVRLHGIRPRRRRIESACRDTVETQGGDLVAHQCDERRDDDGEAFARQCRKLVAQRLAGSGGHHRQHVLARQQRRDDLRLTGPEVVVAEGAVEDRAGGVESRQVALRESNRTTILPPPGHENGGAGS